MSLYRVKLKGKEGIHGYDTYRASSIEDTLKQFLDGEERHKQDMGDRYQPTEIEQVKLLFLEDDPENIAKKISLELEGAFHELTHLGTVGHFTKGNGGDVWEMYAVVDSAKEKLEQLYSLLRALWDVEQNKERYFRK